MIPIAQPYFGPEEEEAVLAVMRSGQFAQGAQVRRFEEAFAAATGARYAVATSNGTTALSLALLAHGIGPGDEVITSPLTFIATANAIRHAGARPVFADVDSTLNLDPSAAAGMITDRTRALMPVHLHGNPADLVALARLAAERGLVLIQDACQAVGATFAGLPIGAYGTAVYSLYATKNLTTGEGGMLTTNDPAVAGTAAALRHQSYTDEPYVHDRVGFNYRMTEIQAAIGLVQLGRLPALTRARTQNAAFYDGAIGAEFTRPARLPRAGHVFHQYTLRSRPGVTPDRDEIIKLLAEAGIAAVAYYPCPVHRQPAYRDLVNPPCPNAEQAAGDIFSIPVHPGVTASQREHIATTVQSLLPAAAA